MKTYSLILIASLFFIFSCSKTTQQSTSFFQEIDPPIENAIHAETYTVNAQTGGEITTAKGSTITFPPQCFVDQEGNTVEGDVNITFNEYHSASEIILSGIPMHIQTETGEIQQFESAGMFDINGEANGKAVAVAPGKDINVSLVSKLY